MRVMIATLRTSFGTYYLDAYKELKTCKLGSNESVDVYASRMTSLLQTAYQYQTSTAIPEAILKCHFVDGLSAAVARSMYNADPNISFAQMLNKARSFTSRERNDADSDEDTVALLAGRKQQRKQLTKGQGQRRESRTNDDCERCDRPGHSAPDCHAPFCFNCDTVGHTMAKCEKPRKLQQWKAGRVSDPRKCYTCDTVGHLARDCPKSNMNTQVKDQGSSH